MWDQYGSMLAATFAKLDDFTLRLRIRLSWGECHPSGHESGLCHWPVSSARFRHGHRGGGPNGQRLGGEVQRLDVKTGSKRTIFVGFW